MAENMIKFLKGKVARLPQTATAGAVYFTEDEGLYLGLADGTYHRYGDFITVANVASLPEAGAHETCMYYCVAENILAKWSGTEWVQINKQKTLAELGGVAKSVYDAKIALLEQADADNATAISGVDTRLQAAEKKLESVATTEGLGELTGRVTTAEGEIDVLQAAIAEGGSVTLAIADAKKAGTDAAAAAKAASDLAGTKATLDDVKALDYATKAEAQGYANAKDETIAAAQSKADSAYQLAEGRATMEQVNAAITGAGHAVQTEVDKTIAAMDAAYKKADGDLEAKLQGNIDLKADQSVVSGIDGRVAEIEKDYLTSADLYNDTKVKEDIAANAAAIEELQGEVDVLNGDAETEGSVAYQIAQAVAAIMENPDDTMNSINELVTWINDHAEDALELSNQVSTNKGDIATLNGLVGTTSVETQIASAIEAALKVEGVDKYALATDLAAAIQRIVALEAIDHDHSNKTVLDGITAAKVSAWDAAEGNAKAYADGLDSAMDTRVKALEAIDHDHANKAELDLIASGDKAKWDDAYAKRHEHGNKTVLDGITAEKVAAWDGAKAGAEATAAAALSAAKTELEGKITAEAERAAAAEAKALTDAKAYADGLAGNYDAAGSAAQALVDAKAYADQAETDAVATAKAYTESLLTWSNF